MCGQLVTLMSHCLFVFDLFNVILKRHATHKTDKLKEKEKYLIYANILNVIEFHKEILKDFKYNLSSKSDNID